MAIREKGTGEEVEGILQPCAKCGCPDIISRKGQMVCRNCGKPWFRRRAPVVEQEPKRLLYHILRCPACRSEKTRVTRTMRPIRYHKCKDCDHNFSTEEARE